MLREVTILFGQQASCLVETHGVELNSDPDVYDVWMWMDDLDKRVCAADYLLTESKVHRVHTGHGLIDWVLIATCKQFVWSNRIGRNL